MMRWDADAARGEEVSECASLLRACCLIPCGTPRVCSALEGGDLSFDLYRWPFICAMCIARKYGSTGVATAHTPAVYSTEKIAMLTSMVAVLVYVVGWLCLW